MEARKKKARSSGSVDLTRLLGGAMASEELRRYAERALDLQEREVEALERLVYLFDHWPHGLSSR